MPHPFSIELATQATLDLSVELQNPSPSTLFARYGDGQLRELRLLQTIFQQTLLPTFSKHKQLLDRNNINFQTLVNQEATALSQQHIQALRYQEQKQLQYVSIPPPLTLPPPSLPVVSQDIIPNISEIPIANEPLSSIVPHDPIIVKVKDPRKQPHRPIIVTIKDPRIT